VVVQQDEWMAAVAAVAAVDLHIPRSQSHRGLLQMLWWVLAVMPISRATVVNLD
jgi:hypothetical protein